MLKKFLRDHKIHKDVVSFKFFDYLFLSKPIYVLGPIAMVLSGMYIRESSVCFQSVAIGLSAFNLQSLLFVLGVSLIISCIFIKNEILNANQSTDSRFNFIEDNIIDKTIKSNSATLIHNMLLGVGFLLILFTSWINLFITAAIYFLWLYSANHIKNIFQTLGLFAIIAFFLILSGWLYSDGASPSHAFQFKWLLIASVPYLSLFLAVTILINFGNSNKLYLGISSALVILGFLLSCYNSDPLATTSLSVSVPFYIFLLFRGADKDVVRAIRYPMFLLIFFLFTIYPLTMIPMVSIYYCSKYYYWHRFDKHFPALAINNDYN